MSLRRGPVTVATKTGWCEVAAGVFVGRFEPFDVSVGLVLGEGQALVVDTRGSASQAGELLGLIRSVTLDPLVVVDTHHHFDHAFGNALFAPGPIWGHARCASRLLEEGPAVRAELAAATPERAREYEQTPIVPPDRTFLDRADLDVGGRRIELVHTGRGHTDNDVAVLVPDAHVVFAGDLVEQSGPPSFGDAYPLEWPGTLGRLLDFADGPIVPGHGEVVDLAFAEAQLADLSALAELARRVRLDGGSVADALPLAPFPPAVARGALERAFAQLAGEL